MSVDDLIKTLERLHIDHQEVQVLIRGVDGHPSPVTGYHFGVGGTTLILTAEVPF